MLAWKNKFFITRRGFINKSLLESGKQLLKIKRLRTEYRVNVRSRDDEWRDISCARLMCEFLLRLEAREVEYNSVFGYYNSNGACSYVKMDVPISRRFGVVFGITTSRYTIDTFFLNFYWFYNAYFSQTKSESVQDLGVLVDYNISRLESNGGPVLLPVDGSSVYDETLDGNDVLIAIDSTNTFTQTHGFKLLTVVDINEGKEKERTALLVLRDSGSNETLTIHSFYFNFLPLSGRLRSGFKRHFATDFEFAISKNDETDLVVLYNVIIFLTSMKLNWVWVEEEMVERFEKITNETFNNKRST